MKCTFTKNLKKSFILLSAAVILFTGCKTGSNDDSGDDSPANISEITVNFEKIGNFTPADNPVEMAQNMAIGWNLGNALDANGTSSWAYDEAKAGKLEYNWLPNKEGSKTSQKLIKAVHAAGFKTIRIPISWHNYMSTTDSTYTISPTFLARAKEVVDWALAENMCVIINIHHDNLTEEEMKSNPGFCLSEDTDIQEVSIAYIESVWKQVATYFKDYDNSLVFELLNEPRCIETDWEWGFYDDNASKASTYCNIITKYEQAALDVIRSTGGNNGTRYLAAPGYAASADYLGSFNLPTDTTQDRLLLAVHAYTPSSFALDGEDTDFDKYRSPWNGNSIKQEIDYLFNKLKTDYVDKGIGVVMGEASASDKNNLSSRIKWAEYYFEKAHSAGIPVILWDNEIKAKNKDDIGGENHGYFNRKTCTQIYPDMLKAMMVKTYGKDAVNVVSDEDTPAENIAFTANYTGKDGDVHFIVESDWASIEIEFVSLVEGIQFAIKSDGVKSKESWGSDFYAKYVQPSALKTSFVLDDVLNELKAAQTANTDKTADDTAPTKLSMVCIQNYGDKANSVKVKSAKVTKTNGTVIDVEAVGDGWNGTISK